MATHKPAKDIGSHVSRCPTCHGTGKSGDRVCPLCLGTKVVRTTK